MLRLTTLMVMFTCSVHGQYQTDTLLLKGLDTDKLQKEAFEKIGFVEKRLQKLTDRTLAKFEKQQEKIRRKLSRIDSSKAARLFGDAGKKLDDYKSKMQAGTPSVHPLLQQFSSMDELSVSLDFLQKHQGLVSSKLRSLGKLNEFKTKLASLQSETQRAEAIQQYIKEQQQLLKEQLSGLGLDRQLNKLNHTAAAYSHLIKDYKQVLNDPGRMQQEILRNLKKIPAFNDFLHRNSALSVLFPSSGPGGLENLAGLQTLQSSGMMVTNRLSGGADGAALMVSGQIQEAQNRLNNLLKKSGSGANTLEMPDYKPGSLKSKTFSQRLEFGANVQFTRPRGLLPQTADLAIQVAYKFSKKGSAGLGASYKLGMGNGLSNISFTHEGVGLRSFADFKLKGSLFINGGFEKNYNAAFSRFSELKNINQWTGSALIGLSKKMNGPKKLKTNIQLLYDLLHNKSVPAGQPLLLRIGYNF